jgi:hypothetical protein
MGVRITRGQRLGNNHAARFALAASVALASASAMADSTVGWLPGSYSLSDSPGGPTTSTLNVSETAGLTTFHVTGEDNETFSISNAFQPLLFSSGAGGGFNMVVPTAALASESWSASQYPFVNFYSQQGGGGVIISNIPGGNPANDLVSTFSSSPTPFSVSGFPGSPTIYTDGVSPATGVLNLTATDASSPAGCCVKTVSFPSPSWSQNIVLQQSQVSATAVVGNQTMNVAASVWQPAPASGSNNLHATSNASLTYYIEVVGNGDKPVAVEMESLLYTTPNSVNGANEVVGSSVATVALPGALNDSLDPLAPLSSTNGEYVEFDETIFLTPGVEYPVTLTADAFDNCLNFTACPIVNQSAFADPIFTVEDGGTLLVSANLNTVPEPSTWAMMLIGFVGLAFAGHRSSRTAAAT